MLIAVDIDICFFLQIYYNIIVNLNTREVYVS
jgi:hypothetical protein